MSQESYEWLNTMTLIGYTDRRGNAWHYRKSAQGAEPNHYPGEIPPEDIQRRLFNWKPVIASSEASWFDADGTEHREVWSDRITLVHPETHVRLGEFTEGFRPHDYTQWLIELSHDVMGSGIGAASAGLLKKGAVAWVQYEMDETMDTPEGVQFRPFFLAGTSLNGDLATTHQRGNQLVVCDNTLAGSLRDPNRLVVKTRHRKNSIGSIPDVRERLGIIVATADEFAAEVGELAGTKVTDYRWKKFLEAHFGERPAEKGKGQTQYDNRIAELNKLWKDDPRVTPWKNTAFGVVQAVSTHAHHVATVSKRGGAEVSRGERNAEKMVYGDFAKLDTRVVQELESVLN
jgi:phage/plasmid-like protein (TIGR03299 family)